MAGAAPIAFLNARENAASEVVADNLGNLCEGRVGAAEFLSRDLHAPISEVLNWRHTEQANEAVGQCRTREADLAAKVIDGPTPGDIAVQQRQCPRNVRIAQTGEPSGLVVR